MEETLISFETAVLAKEKGLDLITMFFYTKPNSKMFGVDEHDRTYPIKNTPKKVYKCGEHAVLHVKNAYSAPTQGLLQKWLREKLNIDVNVLPYNKDGNKKYEVCVNKAITTWSGYNTYEEALEVGLQEALKLIE